MYIVIVNFNGYLDTVECLESALKSNYNNFQILIVDNSAGDSQVRKMVDWAVGKNIAIDTNFPDLVYPLENKPLDFQILDENELFLNPVDHKITFINAKENNGFAAANNIALKYLLSQNDYEYVWLLNNDTVVRKNALQLLVEFSDKSEKKLGLIGSALINYWNPKFLQGVGGKYYKWTGRGKEVGRNKMVEQYKNHQEKIHYVIGASMFIKKDFIIDTGLMDENLFLYYEELDWALRGKKKGWSIGYCLKSKVYHKLGASTKNKSSSPSFVSDFYSVRNRILINKKYYPISLLTLYPSFILFVFNRIKLGMWRRVIMLIKIMLNPNTKHTDY